MAPKKSGLKVLTLVFTGQGPHMKVLVRESQGKLSLPSGPLDSKECPLSRVEKILAGQTQRPKKEFEAVALSFRARSGTLPYLLWISHPWSLKTGLWVPLSKLKELAHDHEAILCEGLSHFWKIFPGKSFYQHLEVQGFGAPLLESAQKSLSRPWIFYGGTFNPWHKGHEQCLISAQRFGQVVVVPDRNPLKRPLPKENWWKFYGQLLKKVSPHGPDGPHGAYVYPGFCGMENPNPTYLWFPPLPTGNSSLLMGEDSLVNMTSWVNPQVFLPLTSKIYVLPRDEDPQARERATQWIHSHNPRLEVVMLPEHSFVHFSSTLLRNEKNLPKRKSFSKEEE